MEFEDLCDHDKIIVLEAKVKLAHKGYDKLQIQLATQAKELEAAKRLLKMVLNQGASHQLNGRKDVEVFLAQTKENLTACDKTKEDLQNVS